MSGATLPDDLLDREPGEAARRLALALLERARAARQRVEAREDPEALHDFRVALRRLRSHFRAFRGELGVGARKRRRRELGELARATNPARDAEVALALLPRILRAPEPRQRRGVEALRSIVTSALDAADRHTRDALLPAFDRFDRRVAAKLGSYRIEVRLEAAEPGSRRFRSQLAERLADHRRELDDALDATAAGDDATAHGARVAAKRLRYLIDPACGGLEATGPVLEALKSLQDLLGELNDLRQLASRLADAAAALERRQMEAIALDGRPRRRPLPERSGFRALAGALAPARERLRNLLREHWSNPAGSERRALAAALERLAGELARG